MLLQRAFFGLKLVTNNQTRLRNAGRIIGLANDQVTLRAVFDALREGIARSREQRLLEERATAFFAQNTSRKILIGLQLALYEQQIVKTIEQKKNSRVQAEFIHHWRLQLSRSKKVAQMVRILQDQQDSRTLHKFMPNLAEFTFQEKVLRHILAKRSQDIKLEFINELRKRIL